MYTGRHGTPIALKGFLKINIKTGKHEIEEDGIVYSMAMEQSILLKHFFKDQNVMSRLEGKTVAMWYKELPKEDRDKVIRTGNLPEADSNGFWPDE